MPYTKQFDSNSTKSKKKNPINQSYIFCCVECNIIVEIKRISKIKVYVRLTSQKMTNTFILLLCFVLVLSTESLFVSNKHKINLPMKPALLVGFKQFTRSSGGDTGVGRRKLMSSSSPLSSLTSLSLSTTTKPI